MKPSWLSLSFKSGTRSIASIIGGNKPGSLMQDIPVESDFPENLLYVRNYDKLGLYRNG